MIIEAGNVISMQQLGEEDSTVCRIVPVSIEAVRGKCVMVLPPAYSLTFFRLAHFEAISGSVYPS